MEKKLEELNKRLEMFIDLNEDYRREIDNLKGDQREQTTRIRSLQQNLVVLENKIKVLQRRESKTGHEPPQQQQQALLGEEEHVEQEIFVNREAMLTEQLMVEDVIPPPYSYTDTDDSFQDVYGTAEEIIPQLMTDLSSIAGYEAFNLDDPHVGDDHSGAITTALTTLPLIDLSPPDIIYDFVI